LLNPYHPTDWIPDLAARIRIVYLITSLEVGGSERQLANLLEGLPSDTYEKHVVCLSGFGAMEQRVRAAAHELYDLRYPRLRVQGALRPGRLPAAGLVFPRLVRLLRRIRPDILHTLIPVCNVIGAVCSKLARVPHIVCTRLSLGDYRDKNPLMARLENWTDPLFELVHCKSRGIMEDVVRREPIPPAKIRIVYNGLRVEPYQQPVNRPALRAQLGIPAGARVIGSVANLHPYKGHVDIVQAAAQVLATLPDTYFLFVGRPAGAEDQVRAEAQRLGLADRVIPAGERPDVAALLQCMDVFVLASHEEGFSNAVLEAMASRLPVVATALGGNLEQVADGVTGYLVPSKSPGQLAEKFIALLQDETLRTRMGEAGFARVQELFSYPAMIAGMEQFYREVMQNTAA
jgi:glycosyltransferase involved in cell wall biosynthesis